MIQDDRTLRFHQNTKFNCHQNYPILSISKCNHPRSSSILWYGLNVCVLANLMILKKKWKCLMKTSFSNCFLLYCKYNSSNTKWLTSRCQTHVHSLFFNSTQQLISSSSPRPSNSNRFQMKKRKRVDDGGVSKWKCSTSNVSSVSFVFSLYKLSKKYSLCRWWNP